MCVCLCKCVCVCVCTRVCGVCMCVSTNVCLKGMPLSDNEWMCTTEITFIAASPSDYSDNDAAHHISVAATLK